MTILNSYKISVTAVLLVAGCSAFAQTGTTTDQPLAAPTYPGTNEKWVPSKITDGVYDRMPHSAIPITWQPIRSTDVLWQKRVWREIDTREKQNMVFRYSGDESTGGGMFIEILIDAIKRGKIKAYSNMDDRFTSELTKDQLMEQTSGKVDSTPVIDPVTGVETMIITRRDFDPSTITKYRIKEDWIFDRNEGKMVVRIIGLAPVKDLYGDDGIYRGSQAMFWLRYPDIRVELAKYEVFNPENDVDRATWDEFFESRQFSSKITKVSNPYNNSFSQEGLSPMEALYESKNVAEEIFNKEHDMWVY
jgi:gliding motility associated protien GldN